MRLPYVNALVTHKRRTTSSGNKKADTVLQILIPAFIEDQGTTADHQQTYLILLDTEDPTSTINADKDTLVDGSNNVYKLMNVAKKRAHYSIRAIKAI